MPSAMPHRVQMKGDKLNPELKELISTLIQQPAMDTLLLPVSFGNQHWFCVIVTTISQRVIYYDSMSNALYTRALGNMAR